VGGYPPKIRREGAIVVRLAGGEKRIRTLLGYTLGQFYGKEGRPYIGTRPSRKAVKSLLKRIHERTTRR